MAAIIALVTQKVAVVGKTTLLQVLLNGFLVIVVNSDYLLSKEVAEK